MIRAVMISLLFLLLACNKQEVLLRNNINPKNTILFIYHKNGIEQVITTLENGKYYEEVNYLTKRKDGYYEDVDLVTNNSIKDYKKVLVKYNCNYKYNIPIPMPGFDGKVFVSIKKLGDNKYLYNSISGNTGVRIFFDNDYKIYKLIRILGPKDSLIYEKK